jgi:hypothetical protein
VKGRSVRSGGNVLTTLSCSASGIFAICCDLTRPIITRLARTFQSTRTRRRREQYMPLVAFCLRHFLADFIICMCEFDFRQAQRAYRVHSRDLQDVNFSALNIPTMDQAAEIYCRRAIIRPFRRAKTVELVLSFKLFADRQRPDAFASCCEDGVD